MTIISWQTILDLTRDCLSAMPQILSSLGSNQLTPEFLDHCFEFLIAARVYDDILFSKFWNTLLNLMASLRQLLASLLALLFFFGVLVAKMTIVAFPYIYKFSENVYEFHTKNFSQRDIIIEISVIIVSLLAFVFRRRLKLQWKRLERSLSKSSRSLAVFAPHVLYLLVAIIIVIFAQKILKVLIQLNVLSVVTLLVPLVSSSAYILRHYTHQGPLLQRQAPEARQVRKTTADFHEEYELLTLWVVLGCYHTVAAFVALVPLSTWVIVRLPYILELVLISGIWLQLSHAFCHFLYEHLSLRLLHGVISRVPLADFSHSPHMEHALSGLRYAGVLSEFACGVARGLLQDSVTLLLILAFLFTPTFIANYGVILVAIVLPAYKSSLVLTVCTDAVLADAFLDTSNEKQTAVEKVLAIADADSDADTSDLGDKLGTKPSSTNLAAMLFTPFKSQSPSSRRAAEDKQRGADARAKLRALSMWLDYWVCFGLMWTLKLFVVRHTWPSLLLLGSGYLQHAYFTGCSEVIQALLPWAAAGPWAWVLSARPQAGTVQPAVTKTE